MKAKIDTLDQSGNARKAGEVWLERKAGALFVSAD